MSSGTDELPRAGRLVAFDLGTVRIGVAVSDSAQKMALARGVIERSGDLRTDHERLAVVVEEIEAAGAVIGLPRSLSGVIGPAAARALAEIAVIEERLGVPVATVDERFSTVEATRRRREAGGSSKSRVDDEAAAVFLQAYLDRRRSIAPC